MPVKTLRTDSHAIRVAVDGNGPPDWLFLHGLVDDLEIWDRVAPQFAERGRVIRMDQRGHGGSGFPAGAWGRQDLAQDVISVLDALESERAFIVGHSMGGVIAMAAAIGFPERVAGLVLIGTTSQCSAKAAAWYRRIAEAAEKEGIDGLRRAIYGDKSRKRIVGDPVGIAGVTRALESLYPDPLTPLLPGVRCPTLLIVGEVDPMGSKASSIIESALPDAHLVALEGRGHWVHTEDPAGLLAAVDSWRERA